MDTKAIIANLRSERSRLDTAIAALEALEGTTAPSKRGRKPASIAGTTIPKKRTMSAAGRKRIAAAQRARWAAKRAAEKKPVAKASRAGAKSPSTKKAAAKPKRKPTNA
jgi:hypothetical protein